MAKNKKIDTKNNLNYSSNNEGQHSAHFEETSANWRFRGIMLVIVIALGFATYSFISTFQRYQANQAQLEVAQLDYQQAQESLAELNELATIPSRDGLLTMPAAGLMEHVKNVAICLDLHSQNLEEENN